MGMILSIKCSFPVNSGTHLLRLYLVVASECVSFLTFAWTLASKEYFSLVLSVVDCLYLILCILAIRAGGGADYK